ncbi:MAG: LysR family transcriptional regulator [Steroidobacteraceae bacterium]|nr:LysR family transcriptional regulator [Steroidobacteraceae bacterium]
MDKLHAMEVFVRVVETGALTRAADSLRIPKATASTLIQKLEAHLGVKLINRTTRQLSVTPDGFAYYERCLAILAEVREAEESLARQHGTPSGRLRVNVPTLMARSVFVPALPDFFARYPDIELALASSERRADLIEEGIDCAVWSGEIEESAYVARRVGFLYFATCAAPSYLAAHGQPAHPDDLRHHRCINRFSTRTDEVSEWVFTKDGTRVQASFRGHIALDDENSYVAAAEAGLGIARIPAFVLKEAMERGTLELVLGDWFPDPAPLYIVYPRQRHLSRKVRVFVDWVAEMLSNHDGVQLRTTLPRSGT